MLLAGLGGLAAIAAGVLATAAYAITQGWSIAVPPLAWAGGLAAAFGQSQVRAGETAEVAIQPGG